MLVATLVFTVPLAAMANVDFAVNTLDDGTLVLNLSGKIDLSDGNRFINYANQYRNAIVTLSSNGGSIVAAIKIGDYIRSHHWATAVQAGDTCASACALVWLGGEPRFAAATARIGFHAAYVIGEFGEPAEIGTGNALVGSYMARLGLPDTAVMFVTAAPPKDMLWLSLDVAKILSIDVIEIGPSSKNIPRSPQERPADPPNVERPAVRTETALAPTTVAPNVDPARVPSSEPALSSNRATDFVQAYFANWSRPNTQALASPESIYAPSVNYYGRQVAVDLVVHEKQAFAERWPERTYSLRAASLVANCDASKLSCTVTGLVDWSCANPARRANASGTASFELKLSLLADGRIVIAEESGNAVQKGPAPNR